MKNKAFIFNIVLACLLASSLIVSFYLFQQISLLNQSLNDLHIQLESIQSSAQQLSSDFESFHDKLEIEVQKNDQLSSSLSELQEDVLYNQKAVEAMAPTTPKTQPQNSSPSKEQQIIDESKQNSSKPASNGPKIHTSWDDIKYEGETGETKGGGGWNNAIYG